MISLLVGDQQAQNFNRILGYSQNSQKHARYLASWHTYKHTHTHTHTILVILMSLEQSTNGYQLTSKLFIVVCGKWQWL